MLAYAGICSWIFLYVCIIPRCIIYGSNLYLIFSVLRGTDQYNFAIIKCAFKPANINYSSTLSSVPDPSINKQKNEEKP
jgi:hypothetical protein